MTVEVAQDFNTNAIMHPLNVHQLQNSHENAYTST